MADPRFYTRSGPFTLAQLAAVTGSALAPDTQPNSLIHDVAAIGDVEAGLLVYAENERAAKGLLGKTGAAIVRQEHASAGMPTLLLNTSPHRAFVAAIAAFYAPDRQPGIGSVAIDPSASIGVGVRLSPGVVIGPNAEIGEGTVIGPNAVIGPGVRLGRNCRVGANVTIAYTIAGDGVVIHPGGSIGQDGFGYIGSAKGHLKVPQLGRVILQDNIEIGACTTIDRGALGDTMIGEGTKIDNLVQVAHNCQIGRHVVLAAQVGMAGSVNIGDFAAMGGQVGLADHITIGAGARIGAKSGVMGDVPPGATYAGFPARPRTRWLREVAWVARSVKNKGRAKDAGSDDDK